MTAKPRPGRWASWHSHNFLNPAAEGAVLPILHLNGYKIANPTILARMPEDQLEQLLRGYGHVPRFVTVADPADTAAATGISRPHWTPAWPGSGPSSSATAAALRRTALRRTALPEGCVAHDAPFAQGLDRAQDGGRGAGEGTWRSHQVPLNEVRTNPGHLEPAAATAPVLPADELFDDRRTPEARDGQERPGRCAADVRNPMPTAGSCCAS